jgi:hypothetical protein
VLLSGVLAFNDTFGPIAQATGMGLSHRSSYAPLLSRRHTYWVNGTIPNAKHTNCTIDEQPFVPFDLSSITQFERREGSPRDVEELDKAWSELGKR